MASAKRMLFILDLDRVLLHRVKTKLDKLQSEKHPYYTKPKYTVKGDHVYPRPGAHKFLKTLFDLGDVAVWTTSMAGYTGPLVMYSFHGLHNISDSRSRIQMLDMTVRTNKIVRKKNMKHSGPYSLQFVWGLNWCDVISPVLANLNTESPPTLTGSPEESNPSIPRLGELMKKDKVAVMYAKGDSKPEFIKNLDRVWQTFPQYTPENTLMIGADPKTQQIDRYPLNNIVIPPFDVLDRYVNFTEDSCLPTLAAFLESQLAPPPSSSSPASSVGEAVDGREGAEGKGEQPATTVEAVQLFNLERLSKAYQELIAQNPDPNQ